MSGNKCPNVLFRLRFFQRHVKVVVMPVLCILFAFFVFLAAEYSMLSAFATAYDVPRGVKGVASVGDWVWQDLDENGLQDVGELGFAEIPVLLYDENMAYLGAVLTDIDGYYTFDNLTPGTYYLEFISPSGYSLSPTEQGPDDAVDSDPDRLTGLTGPVVLVDDENNIDIDAGIMVGCDGPAEPVYLYDVDLLTAGCPCVDGCPRLHFSDPNHPSTVTGYNIYRSSDPSIPRPDWPLYAHNVVDMDEGLPNIQWIDTACDVVDGWYYHITAWSEICGAEGPYSFSYPGSITSVVPDEGPQSGGTMVVIDGSFLGSGSDIFDVTLCGVSASIESQTTSSVTVSTGATLTPGLGDVVVSSWAWGVTIKINGFTYLDSGFIPGDLFSTDVIVGNMRYVPATDGSGYQQGSPSDEPCRSTNETQFQHVLTRHLAVMETEVTRQMWSDLKAVQSSLPADPTYLSYGSGMSNPVQSLTWYEAVLFANLLSVQNSLTRCYYTDAGFTTPIDDTNYTSGPFYCNFGADGYRLPSEGEWEYTTRAGTSGLFSCPEDNYTSGTCSSCTASVWQSPNSNEELWDHAVFCANDSVRSEAVGSKFFNPWNLSDMHGNVWEWCWDWYGAAYPSDTSDYTGPGSGSYRVDRGGSWHNYASCCRSALRDYSTPSNRYFNLGFRLFRSVNL